MRPDENQGSLRSVMLWFLRGGATSHVGHQHHSLVKEARGQFQPVLLYEGDGGQGPQCPFSTSATQRTLAYTSLGGKNFVLMLRGKGMKEGFLLSQRNNIMSANEASLKQRHKQL